MGAIHYVFRSKSSRGPPLPPALEFRGSQSVARQRAFVQPTQFFDDHRAHIRAIRISHKRGDSVVNHCYRIFIRARHDFLDDLPDFLPVCESDRIRRREIPSDSQVLVGRALVRPDVKVPEQLEPGELVNPEHGPDSRDILAYVGQPLQARTPVGYQRDFWTPTSPIGRQCDCEITASPSFAGSPDLSFAGQLLNSGSQRHRPVASSLHTI